MAWTDVPLPFDEGAVRVHLSAHWDAETGWRLHVWSLTAQEALSTPDSARACPTASYVHLSTAELLDVIDAEAARRRGF